MPFTRKHEVVWRMEKPCADCPFNKDGPGRHLRRSLQPGRWRGILADLRAYKSFTCHKTTEDAGNGKELLCAGAIAYQEKHKCTSAAQQVMERLAIMRERGVI